MRERPLLLLAALALACTTAPAATEQQPAPVRAASGETVAPEMEVPAELAAPSGEVRVETVELRSKALSEFTGEEVLHRATVVLPPEHRKEERLPLCLYVHGFGGSHRLAWGAQRQRIQDGFERGDHPRMIFVYLDANVSSGHHVFADSANNGPWGTALVEELIPHLEREYGAAGVPEGRFLMGHSSGGWSALWLQVDHPDFFGGTWPTAPDPVDFRDFTGIDLYTFENAYRDPQGEPIGLVRRGGEFVMSFEDFSRHEVKSNPVGGQIYSFDAVFSPRGEDGQPLAMFDRDTGAIDPKVVEAWKAYDISYQLRTRWSELGPKLAGKLHVFVGTEDTYRLEGALRLLDRELDALGSDAQITFVEGRTHGDLFQPHPDLYPDGLLARIHGEMAASWQAARK